MMRKAGFRVAACLMAGLVVTGCSPAQTSTAPPTSTAPLADSSPTGSSGVTSVPPASGELRLPKGVTDPASGIVVNAATAKPAAPTLVVFEDFQCPTCAVIHERVATTIAELARTGAVRLVFHPMVFLDDQLGNDASKTVTNAASCAADAGAYLAYHDAALSHQPSEGKGFTPEQVQEFASDAGLTGSALSTWRQCEAAGTYRGYVLASQEAALAGGVNGTPTFKLNGQELSLNTINPDTLMQAIEQATT